jgi:hypothetical protein
MGDVSGDQVMSVGMGRLLTAAATAALVAAGLAAAGSPASAATAAPAPDYRHVCAATAPAGRAECLALIPAHGVSARAVPGSALSSAGYEPSDLRSAYDLAAAAAASGHGQTVALVDAYDDPAAASDLDYYRSYFHLPACTTANGCFSKVNQDGAASPLPPVSGTTGWATEESLDLDMVSAICPNCHIILVEADDNQISSLGAGVAAAGSLGAGFVSNSYGAAEYPGETASDADYDQPGVVVTASAGDSGYGVEYPAASPYVTSVGGTTLTPDSSTRRGWSETVWGDGASGTDGDGTGSGCSAYEPKPSWQTDTGCGNRTVADVSADADPNTGVWIYDTYDQAGWLIVGGTSAAAPIIASVYALAGRPASGSYPAKYPYEHRSHLYDPTSGSNGSCGTYLCNGEAGYDGPTGLGTPDGLGAFQAADNVITVTSPGPRITFKGTKITPLQIHAADSGSGQTLTYTATGLPAGLSISRAGKITGTPQSLQYATVTVTATDRAGASGQTIFSWDDGAKGTITSGLSARRCLAARGGSYASGNAIEIAQCNGRSSQRWIIYAGAKSADSIELASGDKSSSDQAGCMGVTGASTSSGAKVATYGCARTASLLWKPGSHGHLTGEHSGKCLSDPGAGRNGTQLTIAACNGKNRERWNLP